MKFTASTLTTFSVLASSFQSAHGLSKLLIPNLTPTRDTLVLSGKTSSSDCETQDRINLDVPPLDYFENVALKAAPFSAHGNGRTGTEGCFGNNYMALDYKITKNLFTLGTQEYPAYTVDPPLTMPSNVHNPHVLYFKLPTTGAYNVYKVKGEKIQKVANLTSTASPQWVPTLIRASGADITSTTYMILKADTKLDQIPVICKGNAAKGYGDIGEAVLHEDNEMVLRAVSYDMNTAYHPFIATKHHTDRNRYGYTERFFELKVKNKTEPNLVWQEYSGDKKMFMTIFSKTEGPKVVQLPYLEKSLLYGAAYSKSKNEIAYMMLSDADGVAGSGNGIDLKMFIINADTGAMVREKLLDTSTAGEIDAIKSTESAGTMKWSDTHGIGVVMARKMNNGHFAGQVLIIHPDTFDVTHKGQTSSHSWSNDLFINEDGSFVGFDLGDNYPRGINLWSFDSKTPLSSKVVYSYKTHHSTKRNRSDPLDPKNQTVFPVWSNKQDLAGKQLYKWSNDNNIYTELGNIIELQDSYLVYFIGEIDSLDGLDNTKTNGNQIVTARNVAYVRVSKDMEKKVTDPNGVLSGSNKHNGTLYDYDGNLTSLVNVGIQWLTRENDVDKSAARLKVHKLQKGNIAMIYEIITKNNEYKETRVQVVNSSGKVVVAPITLDFPLRLPPGDRIYVNEQNNNMVMYSVLDEGKLINFELCIGKDCKAQFGSISGTNTACPSNSTPQNKGNLVSQNSVPVSPRIPGAPGTKGTVPVPVPNGTSPHNSMASTARVGLMAGVLATLSLFA